MALIPTTKGPLEESTLRKNVVRHERPLGYSEWTEYYLPDTGELVKRDVHQVVLAPDEMGARILKDALKAKGELAT